MKAGLSAFLVFLAVASSAEAAVTFTISPPLIVECSNGLGRATLKWEDAGPGMVQVRVDSREGTPLTGWDLPASSAETGDWVRDGMVFLLMNEQGAELARVVARVNCGGSPNAVESVFTTGAYFPLQLGNRWVYRVNSRAATSSYVSWTLVRTELRAERTYYVVSIDTGGAASSEMLLRADAAGRVYRIVPGQSERLWLDPAAEPDPSALLKIERRGPVTLEGFGTFPDALYYNVSTALTRETGVFVRGIGLASNQATMLSGSSGGFSSGMDLVDARVGGSLRLATSIPSLQLSAESTRLDVTSRRVTNCAVPCYFPACYIAGFTDPPDTYKPCFQARVGVTHPAADSVEIELLDVSGRTVFRATRALSPGESFFFQQVPLYSAPNVGFPPGSYRLSATAKLPGGETAGSASLSLRID